ncbi:MAG TPA: carboxypeptidase regulatory-like domain-containing protein [Terriglobales bacterium]|nr:carboxypeptidase regulatory-like domain-containing protein [Terriglobales bacterium]
MKRTLFQLCLFFLVAISIDRAANAQTVVTSGAIRGRVSDPSDGVVVGAVVDLRESATDAKYQRMTAKDGTFFFPGLTVGEYSLKVTASGFRTTEVRDLTVLVGQTTTADVRLQPGGSTQSIVVTATTPLLRTTESTLSTIVSRSLLENVPLSGRRYTDFALLTPNASPDGQTGLVSFAGEQGGEDTGYANGNGANSFTLDGASATSMYFGNARGGERVPYVSGQNSIEEFQVAVSPYSAAYGGGATGFVNTVTRSGSDNFHGDLFYFNRNSGTGANDAVDEAAGLARPVDILQQFGAALGGPLKRERAWFFFDYEQQREKNPISVINSDYQNLGPADFGLPPGTQLPAPNGPLPLPGSDTAPDPNNPVYLQQVSNALNAIQTNLGTHSRYRNDLALFSKFDVLAGSKDRIYLSLNLNRFNSPNGEITATTTPLFGISALANSFVRDYHASSGWTHFFETNLLSEFHASFSRDDQYSTPTGIVPAAIPSVILSVPSNFELGNAGFAGGRTNEAQWELGERVSYIRGKHSFKFGVEGNRTHVTDLSFGGFDPDAQKQNGSLGGAYSFSSLQNFALGIYDTYAQSSGNPKFSFDVPCLGFYAQDTYQLRPHLALDLGLREDFQIYPQPKGNPAFPLTGQFPNQFQRLAPRLGFAWQVANKTVVRGGFGMFYEDFNGLNYRNAVISNGLPSQQSSVSISYPLNPDGTPAVAPNQAPVVFPNKVSDPSLFSAPNISLVDPHFRDPYVLQSSLQIEREIFPETTLSIGTMWTHGIHLISSSAYDMNLMPPQGTTTYIVCPAGATQAPCVGRQVVLPNLDSGLLQEGRISPNFGQINTLISPGINNYNSFFVQLQRRFHDGLALQGSYTLAKNIMSNGVDFNNQFDFSNTHAPYLLDQRHRLTVAGVYQPFANHHFDSKLLSGAFANWSVSTVMLFASGRPYAALLDSAPSGNTLNDSAANQSTANSALGINGGGPSPAIGLNSSYGPWTQQIDMALARRFAIHETHSITFQIQAFNLLNHANFYVQNGNGVQFVQYEPQGQTCGDGQTLNQTCFLIPNNTFGQLNVISTLNGPRVLQFAFKYNF